MDPYIGTPVVSVRGQEVKRILVESGNAQLFELGDPKCLESAMLLEDQIEVNHRNLDILNIARDISHALTLLHKAGFTHGAVSKDNITVDLKTGRARLVANCTMQQRRYARKGDIPIGSGACVTTAAPMHFIGSDRWDTALEDIWALLIVVLQMLSPQGKLNEKTSPVPKVLWLSRMFTGSSQVREDFVWPLLKAAPLPENFKMFIVEWWLDLSKFDGVPVCESIASFGLDAECSEQTFDENFLHQRREKEEAKHNLKVLTYATQHLHLKFLDATNIQDTIEQFAPHFGQGVVVEVAAVLLAIKLSLCLHVKQAEVACAKLAKNFLMLDDVARVFALETWFLTRLTPPIITSV